MTVEAMMTELERARAHLRERQSLLAQFRKYLGTLHQGSVTDDQPIVRQYIALSGATIAAPASNREQMLSSYESAVLAALSWVWEAQEKQNPMVLHVGGISREDVEALQRALRQPGRLEVIPTEDVFPRHAFA